MRNGMVRPAILHGRAVAYVGVPQRVGTVGLPAESHPPIARAQRDTVEPVLAVEPTQRRETHRVFRKPTVELERTQDQRHAGAWMLATDRQE